VAATLQPCVLIPAKSIANGKSRLCGFLDSRSRRALTLSLLRRSIAVASRFAGADNCFIVSHCDDVLDIARYRGVGAIRHSGTGGLNAAVDYALARLGHEGARDVLLMATDMPMLRVEDLRAVSRMGAVHACPVIGADRHGTGTNLLFLPAGLRMEISYGPGSLQRHRAAAEHAAGRTMVYSSAQSAFDIDTPEDLCQWRCMCGASDCMPAGLNTYCEDAMHLQ
jgi:2-phospho-L-lactate guanylyltransferase